MTRDYKPGPEHTRKNNQGNPLFTGLLIGFLLGIGVSLAVVMYIKNGANSFADLSGNKKSLSEKIAEDAQKAEANSSQTQASADVANDDKTKFDFYTILPGSESKINTEDVKPGNDSAQALTQPVYYLQVGAFQTEEDADNMKAKLALQGFEAVVQTATIPDKGVWHRVRVGPLSHLDEITKTKNELTAGGFKTDLIKVNHENQ